MNKRKLSVVMALTLAITINGNVFAAPTSTASTVKQAQEQRQEVEVKVEKLDNQITEVMKQINDNKGKIDKISKDIKSTQSELDTAEVNIKNQQELFNKRVRAMYISGVDSYLGVVLQADNLGDFMSRMDSVKKIVGFDQKLTTELKDKKDSITKKKQSLYDESNKLVGLKAESEKMLSKLQGDKDQAVKLANSLEQQEKNLASAEAAKVQETRAAAATPSRGGSTTSPSVSSSSSDIVSYALGFQGIPYQWGGNGPSSFDCSGFTSYVFAHFGVSLPRIAADQQGAGQAVSRDQLQPGDLVFFGSPAHHVGIYVGNGSYIHAPRTGDVVKVSPLNRSDYSGATRVR